VAEPFQHLALNS